MAPVFFKKSVARGARTCWDTPSPPLATHGVLTLPGHHFPSAGPTCDLAHRAGCRDSVAGVLLESGILSGGSVLLGPSAGRMLAWPADIFTNYAKIPRVLNNNTRAARASHPMRGGRLRPPSPRHITGGWAWVHSARNLRLLMYVHCMPLPPPPTAPPCCRRSACRRR